MKHKIVFHTFQARIFKSRPILLLAISLFTVNCLKADGISSELHYRWISDSTYEFTYVYWLVSAPGVAGVIPDTFHFNVSSQSKNFSANYNCGSNCLLPTTGSNVPPLEPPGAMSCGSYGYVDTSNRPLPFVNLSFQEKVFRFQYTLPFKASDWVISINRNILNGFSTNISRGVEYAECGINNLDFPDTIHKNISPLWMERRPSIPGYLNTTFQNYPVISSCVNRTYTLDQSVTEIEGDFIRYEIPDHGFYSDTSLGGIGARYVWGFTLNYKLPTDTPPMLSIDSITGEILFKPVKYQSPINVPSSIQSPWNRNSTNMYSFPIMAREFRNDTIWVGGNPIVKRKQIGYITRFITTVVHPDSLCADSNTYFVDTTNRNKTNFINLNCSDNPFKIGFNDPIRCSSIDSNGSSFVLVNSVSGDTINIVKAEPICRHDDITDDVKIFLDSILSNGLYYLYLVTGDDGNSIITQCGSEVRLNDSLRIYSNSGPPEEEFWSDSVGSPPNTLELECGAENFTFFSSFDLACHSLEISGSDFYMADSSGAGIIKVQFDSVKVLNCFHNFGSKIRAYLSTKIVPGTYTIHLQKGSDGNTVMDKCHRRWYNENLEILVPSPMISLGPDIEICSRDSVSDTLSLPANIRGHWSTGEFKNSIVVKDFGKYWVKVFSNNGCIAEDTIEIKEIDCTGIEEIKTFGLSVHPNPTTGNFLLKLNKSQSGTIEIYSFDGSIVYEKYFKSQKDIFITLPSYLVNGVYVIKLNTANENYVQKIVLRKE